MLKKLLNVLDPCDVIKLYGADLGRALEHPEIEAKKLVISQVCIKNINFTFFSILEL